MSNLLQQLNNESLLLMYIADELPAEDRMEVEQMMATNAEMRAQMEELRAAHEGVEQGLRTADAQERLASSAGTAARRVGQAVGIWNARRLSTPSAAQRRRRLHFPWWSYPLASAAALVVAAVSWWGTTLNTVKLSGAPPVPRLELEEPSTPTLAENADPNAEDSFAASTSVLLDEQDLALDEAEDELYALSRPEDDVSGILLFGETDEQ